MFPLDLVRFTEEILNGKFHFLCSGRTWVVGESDTQESRMLWFYLKLQTKVLN